MAIINVYHSLPKDLINRKVVLAPSNPSDKPTSAPINPPPENKLLDRVFTGRLSDAVKPKPYYYTGAPWTLLLDDTILFLKNIFFLPCIVLPLFASPPERSFRLGDNRFKEDSPSFFGRLKNQYQAWLQQYFHSGPLDELYPSFSNIHDITVHLFLIITQSAFLLSLPFISFFSFQFFVAYVGIFVATNYVACWRLNGWMPQGYIWSRPNLSELGVSIHDHEKEEWIFLNGVAVGKHWLQGNIDRISLTFHRKVKGVHNQTAGIIFDVIQCLLERCLYFGTSDTRTCFSLISDALLNSEKTKVVLILHSQGALEGSIILDWLINQHPREILQKLEIYTFGNAANHFNNPRTKRDHGVPRPKGRAIRHIEHYANSMDFVSRWGVLHFKKRTAQQDGQTIVYGEHSNILSEQPVPKKGLNILQVKKHNKLDEDWNAYEGACFERNGSGHQFNQHYLDNMFPLDDSRTKVLTNGNGSPVAGTFMASMVKIHNDPKEVYARVRRQNGEAEQDDQNGVNGVTPETTRVYHVSRLWQYVNGGKPEADSR